MLASPLFVIVLSALVFEGGSSTDTTKVDAVTTAAESELVQTSASGVEKVSCEADPDASLACDEDLDDCTNKRQKLAGRVGELESELTALRTQEKETKNALGALRAIVREQLDVATPDGVKNKLESLSRERDDAQNRAREAKKDLEQALSAKQSASRRLLQARQSVRRIEDELERSDAAGDANDQKTMLLSKNLRIAKAKADDWESKNLQLEGTLERAERVATESQHELDRKSETSQKERNQEVQNMDRRARGGARRRRMQHTINIALAIAIATIALVGCWVVLRRGLHTSTRAKNKLAELVNAVRRRRGEGWKASPVEDAAMDGWARSVVLTEASRDAVEKLIRTSAIGATGVVFIALGYLLRHGGGPEALGSLSDTNLWTIIVGFFGPPAAALTAWTAVQQRVREFSDLCQRLGLLDSPRGDDTDVRSP